LHRGKGGEVDAAYLSALSALAGSVVGGLTTSFSTWIGSSVSAKASLRSGHLARREELFRDFIVMASRVYGEALISSEPKIPELVELHALLSRMRVLCQPETVAAGEKVMSSIIDTFLAPNRTFKQLHDLVKAGDSIDPLREFSTAARQEVEMAYSTRF